MRSKNKLFVLSLLVTSILVIQTFALVSAIYIPPGEDPPPRTRYRVTGNVRDADTGGYVSGATVQVYTGSTYRGYTTTTSTGYFNKYIYSTTSIFFFTVKITKDNYYPTQATTEVVGTTALFPRIDMTPEPPPDPPERPSIDNVQTNVDGFEVSISWDVTWGEGAEWTDTMLWWGEDSEFSGVEPITPTGTTHFEVSNLPTGYASNEYWYKIEATNGNSAGDTDAIPVGPTSVLIKHFPTDDTFTYAEASSRDKKFDTDPYWYNKIMVATGDPESPELMRGWLKFSVPCHGSVVSAVLHAYAYNIQPNGHGTITAYSTGTDWLEEDLSYTSSQSIPVGPALSSDTSGSVGAWDSWDVTSLAQSSEVISILLEPSGGLQRGAGYYSREYSDVTKRPYLEIVYAPTECTLVGHIYDANTNDAIPNALVDLYSYTGSYWIHIGTTTSDSENGYFSYSYSTFDSIESFKVLARSAGYNAREKVVSYSGNQFVSFQTVLLTPTHKTWITNDEFSYIWDPEREDYVYSQFWEVNDPDRHETICNWGEAAVHEIISSGATSSPGFVVGLLDLSRWTGFGNLEIEIRVRVSSNYNGPVDVTNLRIGISDRGDLNDILWSRSWNWTYTRDVNDVTLTAIVDMEDENTYLEGPGLYDFFWGYYGTYSTFWGRSVTISYFRISGEMLPNGALDKARNRYTTGSTLEYYQYDQTYDPDLVEISYGSSVNAQNTLGFGVADPIVESGICIALNPDVFQSELGQPFYREYNQIDKVSITVDYLDSQGNPITGDVFFETKVLVNEGVGTPDSNPVVDGLIGLLLEAIGLWSDNGAPGPYIKFGGHTLLFLYTASQAVGMNYLTLNSAAGTASAEFNFADALGEYPGLGSEDFKMSFITTTAPMGEDVFTIVITYLVTLKHVEVSQNGNVLCYDVTETQLEPLIESFNYAHFPQPALDTMHMIELSSPFDNSLTLRPVGSYSRIYSTEYGSNWKIVRLQNGETSIEVSADVPSGYSFSEFWVHSWRFQYVIPPVVHYLDNPLVLALDDFVAYYRIDAYYQ